MMHRGPGSSGTGAWAALRRALGVAATALLVACGGGGGGSDDPPPAADTGTVTGLAVSARTGAAMPGVTVSSGGRTATTGADGRFTLTAVPAGAAVLTFSATDHTRAFANATVAVGQTSSTTARLSPVGVRQTYSAAAGATVAMAGTAAQVTLPAGGIVTAAGTAYTGTVTVELSPIDPASDPGNMPGDMTTRLPDNRVVPIESFGAMAVVLTDGSGNRLNLGSGATATIRIPLATRSSVPPATVPLFWFDETTGLWVQEGSAALRGTAPNQYYEGTVSHFTVWNADQVANTLQVSGCLRSAAGDPVAQARVRSEGIDYSGVGYALTDAAGNFTVAMRRDSQAVISAENAGFHSNNVVAGPSSADITLANCLVMGNGAPEFVRHPTHESVTEGGYVVLQALAKGSAPLRYQWQRNGVDVPGATTSALVIDPVSNADHNASYRVVARNDVGSATSDEAVLTVASLPPAIASQPAAQAVVVGASATFTVAMAPQGAPLQYQWRRNGSDIAGATTASYTLSAAALADHGAVFSVRVFNSVGSVTSDGATLTVTQAAVAPTITQQPAAVSTFVGQSAQFNVVATGSEPLQYRWRRNGQDIEGATGSSYQITAASLADHGARFSVVVSNSAGTRTSNEVLLTVTEPPADSGYYLLAQSGPAADGVMVFANGAQTFRSPALVAVHGQRPGDGVVTVESAGQAVQSNVVVVQTTLQGTQLSGTRLRYSFYFKGTRLYRLDHLSQGAAPAGQPISTLRSTDVCAQGGQIYLSDGTDVLMDLANPGRTWALFPGPGPDNQCGTADDVVRAVRADMTTDDAASSLRGVPLMEIFGSNGTLQGALVRQGQSLVRVDANLANPQTVHTLGSSLAFDWDGDLFGSDMPRVWLFVDGDKLYGYRLDGTAGAPRVLATLTADEQNNRSWQMATRGGTAFVALSNGTSTRVLRISEDLGTPALVTSAGPADVFGMVATPTRLILHSMNGVSSIPHAGGSFTTLFSNGQMEQFGSLYVAGETVYFSTATYSEAGMARSVEIAGSDGSNRATWAGNAILGSFWAPSVDIGQTNGEDAHALLVAGNLPDTSQYAGATLRAVLGSSRTTLLTYGTLPATPADFWVTAGFQSLHYGQPDLLMLVGLQGNQEVVDLMYYDSDVQGSLTRLTTHLAQAQRSTLRPLAMQSKPPRWLKAREGLRLVPANRAVGSPQALRR